MDLSSSAPQDRHDLAAQTNEIHEVTNINRLPTNPSQMETQYSACSDYGLHIPHQCTRLFRDNQKIAPRFPTKITGPIRGGSNSPNRAKQKTHKQKGTLSGLKRLQPLHQPFPNRQRRLPSMRIVAHARARAPGDATRLTLPDVPRSCRPGCIGFVRNTPGPARASSRGIGTRARSLRRRGVARTRRPPP